MTDRVWRCLIVSITMSFSFLCPSALAGPPFKTDDPEPVDYRHWEFYLASVQQFTREETDATAPHIEINYGVIPNMQLHIIAPLGYTRSGDGTHYGYSDTEIGLKYRFVGESGNVPQIGVFPLIEFPTGSESKNLGAGKMQAALPLWLQKSWGKLTTYGGGGAWYNPGPDRKNWAFAGWEIQYECSDLLTLGSEFYYQTAESTDSDANTSFGFGGFVNLNEHHHLLFSIGHTLSGAAAVSGYLGYQLTI